MRKASAMYGKIKRKFQQSYPLLMYHPEDNSFARFGLEVGSGWLPLVYELFGLLNDLQAGSGQAVSISQVKQKFGSLRIYISGGNSISEDMDLLESVFESLSMRICDICGAPGRLKSDDGYWCTRCPHHHNSESHETLHGAAEKTIERFLDYQRRGIDTSGIVYLSAARSSDGEYLGCLKILEFPEHLVSVEKGLIPQLLLKQHIDQPVSELAEIVKSLKAEEKRLIGITDGSRAADQVMGRPGDD